VGDWAQRAIMAACMDSELEVEAAAHTALKDGLPQGAAQPVLDVLARNATAEPEVRCGGAPCPLEST
jgi:hypothetical protein